MKLAVEKDSWHHRIYMWYRSRTEWAKPKGFKENLCHYMRILLIWAPIHWFLNRDLGYKLRPWSLSVLFTTLTLSIAVWTVFPEVVFLVWAISGVVCILLVVCFGVYGPVSKLATKIYYQVTKSKWFQKSKISVLAQTVICLGMIYFSIKTLTLIGLLLVWFLVILFCWFLLLLFMACIFLVFEGVPATMNMMRKDGIEAVEGPGEIRPRPAVLSFIQLIKHLIKSKTGSKICPFIEFV